MSLSNIKTKIAALLAKAEGTDNEFEAATFMAKVNELLERHQMSMHDIRSHSMDSNDPMGKERGNTKLFNTHPWARLVANALARYYGCRFVFFRQGNHIVYDILGRDSARTTFELLFPFVLSQVRQQAKRLYQKNPSQSRAVWEREVGQALSLRIWAIIPEAEQSRLNLEARALIPVSNVDAFVKEAYSEVKKAKSRDLSFSVAAKNAANNISINVQATGNRSDVKLIG